MAHIEKEYYYNGNIKFEVFVNDNKKEEVCKEYFDNQQIYIKCNYINNKKTANVQNIIILDNYVLNIIILMEK